ncbi:MAG: DUF6444 domain-containing protein [Actinomycetota bacterium]|nr:DUF6444 domain-containing protein [Actinomycetota bacterium]
MSAQAKLIEELQAEVAELKRQTGRISQNSSTPPSAEGLAKPPPRSMRGCGISLSGAGTVTRVQGHTCGYRLRLPTVRT